MVDNSSPARLGLMHIGVFILLLLSGERNFGEWPTMDTVYTVNGVLLLLVPTT